MSPYFKALLNSVLRFAAAVRAQTLLIVHHREKNSIEKRLRVLLWRLDATVPGETVDRAGQGAQFSRHGLGGERPIRRCLGESKQRANSNRWRCQGQGYPPGYSQPFGSRRARQTDLLPCNSETGTKGTDINGFARTKLRNDRKQRLKFTTTIVRRPSLSFRSTGSNDAV